MASTINETSMIIDVFDSSLNYLGVIDACDEVYFKRSWYEAGDFTIKLNINSNPDYAALLANNNIVMINKDVYKAGIITHVADETGRTGDGKGSQIRTAKGFELKFIFQWRIISNFNYTTSDNGQLWYKSAPAETCIKQLVNDQCGPNSTTFGTTNKLFPLLSIASDLGRGPNYVINERGTNLYGALFNCASAAQIGWFCYLDLTNKKIVLDCATGLDRSADQSSNPQAVFSPDRDTLKGATVEDGIDGDYANLLYVQGQTLAHVSYSGTEPAGMLRHEKFVDSSQTAATATQSEDAQLATIGAAELLKYTQTLVLDGEVLAFAQLRYRTDYDVGDLVTVNNGVGSFNVQMLAVQEEWRNANYQLTMEWGKPAATITRQIFQSTNTAKGTAITAANGVTAAANAQATADSKTQIFYGTADPPTTAANQGDQYHNTANGKIWEYVSGGWAQLITLYGDAGTIGGALLGSTFLQSTNYVAGTSGWKLDNAAGAITAFAGAIGGWSLGAATISATNIVLTAGAANVANILVGSGSNAAGLGSPAAGTDIAVWAGSAFSGRASAPFRVTAAGAITATSGAIGGFTLTTTQLSATNFALTSGAANAANLTVGASTYAAGLNAAGASGDIAFWAGSTFANRASAPFRVTAGGALTATSATISGTITATAGTVGGWTIGATALTAGSAGTTVGIDSGGTNPAFYAGSATPASAPFRVTQAGALTATNATITGAITATSGAIGGATIAASYVQSTNYVVGASGWRLDNAGGALYALAGLIGGWTVGATSLAAGSAGTTVGLDSGGTNPAFYAGSATPSSAPFRVSNTGALTATSATITGTITATAGSIGGITIASGKLYTGAGTWADAGTGFYLDSSSYFSLANKLYFNPTTGQLNVSGILNSSGGAIGGWIISATTLASAAAATAIVLDQSNARVSVVDSGGTTKTAMGYLGGLANPAGGTLPTTAYGFWAASGDAVRIIGSSTTAGSVNLINYDGSISIYDNTGATEKLRFGSISGNYGVYSLGSYPLYLGASGSVDVTIATSGAVTFGTSITVSTLTAGSVLFAGASGLVSQANSNLFWDNANNRLKINGASPANASLTVMNTDSLDGAFGEYIGVSGSLSSGASSQAIGKMGFIVENYFAIAAGYTNSSYILGSRTTSLRNYRNTGDAGSLATLYGAAINYGHYNTDTSAPQTTVAYGLYIQPYIKTGTIGTMYDIYIGADSTGGTVTNRWGIYQAGASLNKLYGALNIANTTASTSPTSGALILAGGAAVGGSLFVNGANMTVNANTIDVLLGTANNPTTSDPSYISLYASTSGNLLHFGNNLYMNNAGGNFKNNSANMGGAFRISRDGAIASFASAAGTATITTPFTVDASGNETILGNLTVSGTGTSSFAGSLSIAGTLVGTGTTQAVFNTVATTINFGGAASAINIGASGGTVTIAGNITISGTGTNTLPGSLSIGGGLAGQFSNALVINPTTYVGSSRASLSLGGWQVGQDSAGNGTKNFYIYDSNTSSTRLTIDTSGNATLSGSLTVSGAGTSSIAGSLSVTGNISGSNINQALLTTSSPTFAGLTVNGQLNATYISTIHYALPISGMVAGSLLQVHILNGASNFVYWAWKQAPSDSSNYGKLSLCENINGGADTEYLTFDTIGQRMTVNVPLTVGSTLTVTGAATFNNSITATSTLSVSGNLTANGLLSGFTAAYSTRVTRTDGAGFQFPALSVGQWALVTASVTSGTYNGNLSYWVYRNKDGSLSWITIANNPPTGLNWPAPADIGSGVLQMAGFSSYTTQFDMLKL